MHWRCLSNPFGYCSGEPEFGENTIEVDRNTILKTCIRDPKTCRKFLTFAQVTKEFSQEKTKTKGKKA